MGTITHLNPIDIFNQPDTFVSVIMFILQADYPVFGFDPIWVDQARTTFRANPDVAKAADPRLEDNCLLRLSWPSNIITLCGFFTRRYTVHGWGTTVILANNTKLESNTTTTIVIKLSFVPHRRWKEYQAYKAASQAKEGVFMTVSHSIERHMDIWRHPIVQQQRLLPEEQFSEVICFEDICYSFTDIKDPIQLLERFVDAFECWSFPLMVFISDLLITLCYVL